MNSYRSHFTNPNIASSYDAEVYAENSYSSILWKFERAALLEESEALRARLPEVHHLDFACGTGRILRVLEDKVTSSCGIDISAQMLERARPHISKASLHCMDVTDPDNAEEVSRLGPFDLITTFRFVLNAEAALRRDALRILVSLLRNRESRLILNNHGNLLSHKILGWPRHHLLPRWKGRTPTQNYLTDAQVRNLLDEVGLEVVSTHSCGVLGGTAARMLPGDLVERVERRLAQTPVRQAGVNRMYVTRLRR